MRYADRVGALGGLAWPPRAVAPGAFLGEALDADLADTGLEPAREPGAVLVRLSAVRDVGGMGRIVDDLSGLGSGRRVGVACLHTDRDRAVVPTARQAFRVRLGLRISLALGLLQAPLLAQRRTHLAAPHLADPAS